MEDQTFFEKIEAIKMPIRIVILVGTVVLLAGAFTWLVYFPKTDEIANTKKSIVDLNKKLNRAKIQRKKLPKVRAEKKKVDAQFKEALKLLPNEKEIPKLLVKLSELANESNLEFPIFKPKKGRTRQFYVEVPISIEVRGPYHNVAVFFDKVGHMERIMNILNVSMRPVKARSTSLVTTCEAVTYMFRGK